MSPHAVSSRSPIARLVACLLAVTLGVAESACKKNEDSDAEQCAPSAGKSGEAATAGKGSHPDDLDGLAKAIREDGVQDSQVYADDAVRVDLYGCARVEDSDDVLCVFDLVGSGYDWEINFAYCANLLADQTTVATDDAGRKFSLTSASIANAGSCRYTLVEEVSTEARIRFNDVHSESTAFTLITIPFKAAATQQQPAQAALTFRDVALAQ